MSDPNTRALAFNAVAPALKAHDQWLPLSVRQAVADAVLAAIEPAAPAAPDPLYVNKMSMVRHFSREEYEDRVEPTLDPGPRCSTGDHPPHDGFTCAEVKATGPYWRVRWEREAEAQQANAAPTGGHVKVLAHVLPMTEHMIKERTEEARLLNEYIDSGAPLAAPRLTADTITDDQLDQLTAQAARLEPAIIEQERLATELAQFHEGEEPHPDKLTEATPAQWIWNWNQSTPAERLDMAARIQRMWARADRCVLGNHEGRLAELPQPRADLELVTARACRDSEDLATAQAAIERVRAECEAIGTPRICNAVDRILGVLDGPSSPVTTPDDTSTTTPEHSGRETCCDTCAEKGQREQAAADQPKEQPMPTEEQPTCTATIEGPHVPGPDPTQCTRPAGHPELHAAPTPAPGGRTLWSDHYAGATPHKANSEEH